MSNIPDIDELKSGERRKGIYSALFTFMHTTGCAACCQYGTAVSPSPSAGCSLEASRRVRCHD